HAAEHLPEELAERPPGAGRLVGGLGRVLRAARERVPGIAELTERLADDLEGRADVRLHRAKAADDAAGDAGEDGDELGEPANHRRDRCAGCLAEAAELGRRQPSRTTREP